MRAIGWIALCAAMLALPAGIFSGELALDLAGEPKAQGVRELWLHLVLANTSGKATNFSNRLTRLTITGALARESRWPSAGRKRAGAGEPVAWRPREGCHVEC